MFKEPISFNTFNANSDTGKSTTGLNGDFLNSRLLIDCLLRMNANETDKDELIDLLRQQYEGNDNQLNIVEEFRRCYSRDKALWWYTRESFFYRILNKALRTQNIELLFLLRSFIFDIGQQLQYHQSKSRLRVFRGQLMSRDEMNSLRKHIGQYISIKAFFSSSMDCDVANVFSGYDAPSNYMERVLFEIDADPSVVTTQPFADIRHCGNFSHELEVLFMVGSIFQVNDIRSNDGHVQSVKMRLCSENENTLQQVFTHMRNRNGIGATNMGSLGNVLWDMAKFDLAEKYYLRFLNENPPSNLLLCNVYRNLASIAARNGASDMILHYKTKAMEVERKIKTAESEFYQNNRFTLTGYVPRSKTADRSFLSDKTKMISNTLDLSGIIVLLKWVRSTIQTSPRLLKFRFRLKILDLLVELRHSLL